MPRPINLRQIEVFRAVIEHGTVSRAAEVAAISQPAASKLLMHLESDTGLKLFDRRKGRLVPTTQGLRFHGEVERIFAGLQQVETAVAVIRREERGQLVLGVIPALAGTFTQRATMNFLQRHPGVYCSIQSLASRGIVKRVLARELDIGIVTSRVDHPSVVTEPLLEQPLLCIMPVGHPLARHRVIRPEHLDGAPFVSFNTTSAIGQAISRLFETHQVRANVVLTADVNPAVCHFVAAGLGVSLVHPLFIAGVEDLVAVRLFEPATPFDFLLCHGSDARNSHLIAEFTAEAKAAAARLYEELAAGWR